MYLSYFRYALASRLHQPLKSIVATLIPRSRSALVDRWQSYGLCTLALGSLPCLLASIPSRDRPMISAKSSQISYLVNLSSEENWRMRGRLALSWIERYLEATSASRSGWICQGQGWGKCTVTDSPNVLGVCGVADGPVVHLDPRALLLCLPHRVHEDVDCALCWTLSLAI